MLETWVRSLGREDPLEMEMATHSSILAWRIPWTEEPCGLQSMRSQRVGCNCYIWHLNDITKMFHTLKFGDFLILHYIENCCFPKKMPKTTVHVPPVKLLIRLRDFRITFSKTLNERWRQYKGWKHAVLLRLCKHPWRMYLCIINFIDKFHILADSLLTWAPNRATAGLSNSKFSSFHPEAIERFRRFR